VLFLEVKDKVEDLNALLNSLEGEKHVVDLQNEELEDLMVAPHEGDLNDENCEFSIENDVLSLVPNEASCDANTYLHEEEVATTFSILDMGLVSQCDIPFQISEYKEEYFHDLKRNTSKMKIF
jgi:hypothetical protein